MTPKLRRALLVTDFSETANKALPYAYSIVEPGGEVVLLHIIEHSLQPSPLYAHYAGDDLFNPDNRKKAIAAVEEHLKTSVPKGAADKKVKTVPVGAIYPVVADGIVTEAETRKADVIVIGSHGRTGLAHVMMGSVAEAVIRRSRIPVLVVPRQ
jgi:nucleotide-binding universal stress UspA family protein